jgi:phosphonate transport system substrate-binding protein
MSPSLRKPCADRSAGTLPFPKKKQRTSKRPLRFASFLAPNMFPVYQFIVRQIARRLGCAADLFTGSSYRQLAGDVDAVFMCGLAYVELSRTKDWPFEPLAAPVLQGERYGGRPVYFSDVIVRRERPFRSFADLRGCSWAYNEPRSHSGYGIVRYELARRGQTRRFFGTIVEAGYHERSIRLVCSEAVDAAAIDSQVLAVAFRDHPELARQLRIVESFGPSTIQPLVVARRLPERLRADLRTALLELGEDPRVQPALGQGFIERFVPVSDSSYDDIRHMLRESQAAGTLTGCAVQGANGGGFDGRGMKHNTACLSAHWLA